MIESLNRLRKENILVVGDVMLDRYWWGTVDRISPEAPVPVVALETVTHVAGGAANVAANIKGLECEPILIGIAGTDPEADILGSTLEQAGITGSKLFRIEGRKTSVKNRVVAHNQHMLRFDQETVAPIDDEACASIIVGIEMAAANCRLIVISDYAKGVLTPELTSRVISIGRKNNIPVVVDPKGRDYSKYRGSTVITPNQKEAEAACGLPISDETVDLAGGKLLTELDLQGVVITRGEKGMRVYGHDAEPADLPASARMVYNVTGAGDTVIAALAVALASELPLIDAARLANFAAGIVVEDVGTTTITLAMLHEGHARGTAA